MPSLPGIDHPRFTHVSKTHYSIRNPDSNHLWYLHVGQIMTYLAFDLHLRNHGTVDGFTGIPISDVPASASGPKPAVPSRR